MPGKQATHLLTSFKRNALRTKVVTSFKIAQLLKQGESILGQNTEYIEENPALSYCFTDADGNPYPDSGETEELQIDGPLSILFDGNTITVINESDKNSLKNSGLTDEEFRTITSENYQNATMETTGEDMKEGYNTSYASSEHIANDSSTGENNDPKLSQPEREQNQNNVDQLNPEESLPPE